MSYERNLPARDLKIENIAEGSSNVRIAGIIVNVSDNTVEVNDGTGQVSIRIGDFGEERFEVKCYGRFIIWSNKEGDQISANLIAFTSMTKEQLNQYQRMVKLEGRIPK